MDIGGGAKGSSGSSIMAQVEIVVEQVFVSGS